MKRLRIIFYTLCFTVMLELHCFAYLDPSVMTYTIQVIAGVVVAFGTVAGILWRRAKKKVQKQFGIDENAKKEIEDDVIEIESSKKEE